MTAEASPTDLTHLDVEAWGFVHRVVAAARSYLDAHVSVFAEMTGDEKIIRSVDGPADAAGLPAGRRFDAYDTYCYRMLQGQIPEAVYAVRHDPQARAIPLTDMLGIESYMGVPVRLPDGRVLGTLCCINFPPHPEARERDLRVMRFLAQLIGGQVETAAQPRRGLMERRAHLQAALAGGLSTVFQPIVSLSRGRAVDGVEALSRFRSTAHPSPDAWFREAWAVGLGPDLEVAAVASALAALPTLPPALTVAVNVSPQVVHDPRILRAFERSEPSRLVVEVTEHAMVDDYAALVGALDALRALGVRVAVDDVGAGYSSLRHVLMLRPDIAKLDMSLTRSIDVEDGKQALVAGVVAFASRAGIAVLAEGVETEAESATLLGLGVTLGQGYLYGRPAPWSPADGAPR